MQIFRDSAKYRMNSVQKSKAALPVEVLTPTRPWWDLRLHELVRYKDLLFLFVKRDFIVSYKQTVLGPLWVVIQPLLATIVFSIIFGKVANLPTDNRPMVVFYLTGITAWGYFADCLNKTSKTFLENAGIFGKVYFPRLILPLAIVVSSLIKFGIQFILLLGVLIFYIYREANIDVNIYVLYTPLLILIMAGLGLGFGILISSLTTRYRDLQYLIQFGVQMLMYATPVVYPLSMVPDKYRWLVIANPMTSVIETFKRGYLGVGTVDPYHLAYSLGFMFVILFIGIITFNKVERNFIDTI